ncbi:CAP domain-containing protein [Nocardioides alcanivorans]|uniref:CAP domain-containing protein n=1 Tax=Nocardioides alcanivorans TaxID=2897352 RepID=UPI001F43D6C8|nr:CAP domain-containing protein [Nocardioides alcanivorans]
MVLTRRTLTASLALLLAGLLYSSAPTYAGTAPSVNEVAPRAAAPLANGKWEKKILKQTNKHRKKNGCKALKANNKLRKAARKHTKLMAASKQLSHQLPGEATLGKRITQAGYRNWRAVAENIAYGYANPKAMVKAWMNSPGHRKNILNCSYRHLGVGVKVQNGVPWATQDFGRK